jgi:hypothetical protein
MSSNNPYHVYYDLSYINNNTTGNKQPVVLTLSDTRANAYIANPSDYFVSVIRFNIATPSLPVFIPSVELGQSNVNKLSYTVTLTYKTFSVTNNVTYIPFDSNILAPKAPLLNQDISTDYYYIYSYQSWMYMMNQTLFLTYQQLKTNVTNAGQTLPSNYAPFFNYDTQACVYIFNADQAGYNIYSDSSTGANNTPNPNAIKVIFNTAMYNILNNFSYITSDNNNSYQLVVYSMNGANVLQDGSVYYLQMFQEGSTVALLNPIESIVLTSGIIPINNENVGIPKLFNANNLLTSQSTSNSNISPIISDFQIEFSALNQYRPVIQYTPSNEYRLIDLYGTTSLSNIQIGVLWKDVFGNFHEFYLNAGGTASIKLLFRRRDFFNATIG